LLDEGNIYFITTYLGVDEDGGENREANERRAHIYIYVYVYINYRPPRKKYMHKTFFIRLQASAPTR
jgi:hypothetical protein